MTGRSSSAHAHASRPPGGRVLAWGGAIALAVTLAPAVGAPAAPTLGPSAGRVHAAATGSTPAAAPRRIDLPRGWQPEGVTTDGRRLYVGSLADGAIYRANPRTGSGAVLARGRSGRVAVGIDYDRRRDLLWVVGGPTGVIRAHDADTGKVRRVYRFPAPKGGTDRFLNDVVVTRHAVYGTDSMYRQLVVVPLRHGDRLPPKRAAHTLRLTGDLRYEAGFNLNGIVRSGRHALLSVQSNTGKLFRIRPATGATRQVNLHGRTLVNGDGLERARGLLYVVRNQNNRVAVVDLSRHDRTGRVVGRLTARSLDVPSTAAAVRRSLWVVNARFGTPPGTRRAYWLTRLPLR
ncbi:MAG TPA: superoxide dismutase [Nocardioidaceae bacterium]|nr:superoxide dismutase [Nocardioidaceae bacterium]